jgi:hypothetical protein
MASDMFLKLGDIKGESTDDKHKDEIEVLAFSWNVSNPGTMAVSAPGGSRHGDLLGLSDHQCLYVVRDRKICDVHAVHASASTKPSV